LNIAKLLHDTAARVPEHVAVDFNGQVMTYAEFDQKSDALAWGLKEQGLGPGQVCVLMMPNSLDWVVCYYALAKLGAVVLPVNFLYRTQELQHIFSDSGARAFIGHGDHLDYAGPVLEGMPQIDIRCVAGPAAEGYLPLAAVA